MKTSGEAIRPWCGICQFPGKKEFLAGNVIAAVDAGLHEIETDFWRLVDDILPTRPKLINLVPGQIVFIPAEERNGNRTP